MAFTSSVRDAMLDLIDETGATAATHVSLHTDDPGTTGADEVTGGSYARQAVTWGAASGGSKTNSSALTFSIPAGTTITHVGLWTASTNGTFLGGGPLDSPQSYPTGGTYTINPGDLEATLT